MRAGFRFSRVPCPECGEKIAENWLLRHLKREHPRPAGGSSPGISRLSEGSCCPWDNGLMFYLGQSTK